MKITDYFAGERQLHWLEEIRKSDWGGGQFLYELLLGNRFSTVLGEGSRLLLLTEGDQLLAFCTYAERDDIPADGLTPWTGFVYTFPQHRGKRRMGKLLEQIHRLAKADGYPFVYISTDHTGLYEKYACAFWKTMKDIHGNQSRVYRMEIQHRDYGDILGSRISGRIDRPAGSRHSRYPEMIYPVNYGYAEGIMAGGGEEQDVYVLGTDKPLKSFTGTVTAVWHRLNDVEDKWIVSVDGKQYPDEEIIRAVSFQEQYFMGELYR